MSRFGLLLWFVLKPVLLNNCCFSRFCLSLNFNHLVFIRLKVVCDVALFG